MAFSPRAYVLFSLFTFAWSQTTHIVTVGAEGSFYEPATIFAFINDTVRFIFEGPSHGVIQSTFNDPCVPLPGGFSSGFAGRGDNYTLPAPVWDLQIRNVSHTLWFYCANTRPVSHCASGMVGAINPPSNEVYNSFKSIAKAVTTTALVGPSVVTNAPDAFATNSPLPTTTFGSTITFAPLPSPPDSANTPLATSSPSSSSTAPARTASHKAAIIGGSVGGVAVVVIVAILTFLMLCRRRKIAKRGSTDFFRYKAHSPELGPNGSNGVFAPVRVINSSSASPSAALLRMTDPPQTGMRTATTASPASIAPQRLPRGNGAANLAHNHNNSDASTTNLRPEERPPTREGPPHRSPRPLPPTLDAPAVLDHKSSSSSLPGASARDSASTNIQALAREVAAVLMQNPQNIGRAAPKVNGGETSSRESTHVRTESPAPPRYRAS